MTTPDPEGERLVLEMWSSILQTLCNKASLKPPDGMLSANIIVALEGPGEVPLVMALRWYPSEGKWMIDKHAIKSAVYDEENEGPPPKEPLN